MARTLAKPLLLNLPTMESTVIPSSIPASPGPISISLCSEGGGRPVRTADFRHELDAHRSNAG